VRVEDVPVTTCVPTSTPLWISASELVTSPVWTDTSCGCPAESSTRTEYEPAVPTSAIAGTAMTLAAEAVVIEIDALIPDAVPWGGVGSDTRMA